MARDSEFRAYEYIRQVLKDLGWDTRNPSKGGEIYYQGEYHKHDELLTKSLGATGVEKPENTARILWDGDFRYWLIESKALHEDLSVGVQEAKDYADKINAISGKQAARFATGIAGTPDTSFLVSTSYWNGKKWHEVEINSYKTTGFLSREQCYDILEANNHNINNFDTNPDRFLKKANEINTTLHENGVGVGDRAEVMGALLLALADESPIRLFNDPKRMIDEINSNIKHILESHGKSEFADTIKLRPPATSKNHKSYWQGIVQTLQHLREMNVRSAINSDDDALGKFYETFLKYANGAKEMGIVLTPRHITKFAVDTLGVTSRDIVFDPTCGTGGFLVGAMDANRRVAAKGIAYDKFKQSGLWGVEKEDPVFGLALVNMIFRGDGKSGLQDGSCFDYEFWKRDDKTFYLKPDVDPPEGAKRPFSRVFMNPPFKIKKAPEVNFVDYALRQTRVGGLLFAVLPSISINGDKYAKWRKETLKRHTIKAVIKLDKNVFYPIQEGTYGLIIEAHCQHDLEKPVFFGILFDDKHRPRKSKMLSQHNTQDNVERMTQELRQHILGKPVLKKSIPQEQQLAPIGNDNKCTYAPEFFIKNKKPKVAPNIVEKKIALESARKLSKAAARQYILPKTPNLKKFSIHEVIAEIVPTPIKNIKSLLPGFTPVVSATAENNGVAEWKDVADSALLQNCISISKTHNTKPCQAFWHPYSFTAIDTVHIIRPIFEVIKSEYALVYLCQSISETNSWRYDYARPVVLDELEVFLPSDENGQINFAELTRIARDQMEGISN